MINPIAFMGIAGFIAFYRYARHGFSFRKLFTVKKRWIVLSMIFAMLASVGFCGLSYMDTKDACSYSIKFNYEEADSGLAPNGIWLNISDAVGDEVLEAIAKKLNVNRSKLDGCLEVSSSMDSNSLDTNNPKIATDYSIAVVNMPDYISSSQLIHAAAEAYQEYFMENCAEQMVPLKASLDGMEDMDYQDAIDMLEMEAEKLKNYLSDYKWDNLGYSDEENGNFASIVQKVENYIDVELENFRSFVLENGVTKNSSEYKETLKYKNALLQKDYDKNMSAYDVDLEAIDLYNSKMVSVVLVPTQDDEDNFYMSRTKIGVDYFATDANEYSTTASKLKKQIDENIYIMKQLSSNNKNRKKAEEMLSSLQTELNELSDTAQSFFQTFMKNKRDGYMKIVFRETTAIQAMQVKRNVVYAACFGMMILLTFVCRKENHEQIVASNVTIQHPCKQMSLFW